MLEKKALTGKIALNKDVAHLNTQFVTQKNSQKFSRLN